MKRSSSDWTVRSWVATMYHLGFDRHAVPAIFWLNRRFSGNGDPRNWVAADILIIMDGLLMEHWDVLQDEAFDRRAIAAAKLLINEVSLPPVDRFLEALNSFQTALTWPEALQRIGALLNRGLQQDGEFERRWPKFSAAWSTSCVVRASAPTNYAPVGLGRP